MNLFFKNPATLITYKSLFDRTNLKATFVNLPPRRHNLPLTENDFKIQNRHFEISQFICHNLNISLSRIDFANLKTNNILTESGLYSPINNGNKVILWASSEYCYFGFNNYFQFPFTKYNLKRKWRTINLKNQLNLYMYNERGINTKLNNVSVIDLVKSREILSYLTKTYNSELQTRLQFDDTENFILFLTHYTNNVKSKFFKSYISKVTEIAEKENWKILIKRHKYDLVDYSAFFDKKLILKTRQDIINQFPVEFFFNLENLRSIVSTPSSSLVFADVSKLKVYIPTDKSELRTEFLHVLPFLYFIKVKAEKI